MNRNVPTFSRENFRLISDSRPGRSERQHTTVLGPPRSIRLTSRVCCSRYNDECGHTFRYQYLSDLIAAAADEDAKSHRHPAAEGDHDGVHEPVFNRLGRPRTFHGRGGESTV